MIITETGILVSTDPNMRDPAPLNFKIEGGQVGDNTVRATGLTANTTYYAQSYFVKDGIYIRQKGLTEFKTAAQEEVLKIKNAYAGNNSIGISRQGAAYDITLSYSTDLGQTWNTWTSAGGTSFNVVLPQNGEVWLKGNNERISNANSAYYKFTSGQIFDCEGSISALLSNSIQQIPDYCFYALFTGSKVRIPPTMANSLRLGLGCYMAMFTACTQMTQAPALPATELAPYCYMAMFDRCTITQAPALPATTLAQGCYSSMFINCTSLTQAPALPATNLAPDCYTNMFRNSGLVTAPTLPATTLYSSCYSNMFNSCTALTQAPSLPATTLAAYCYSSMFYGCTSLTQAPDLPATTMYISCYSQMFRGCTALTTVGPLRATTLNQLCYSEMFYGCTSLTTAPEIMATTAAYNCFTYMFYGCSSLNKIIVHMSTWNTNYANNWVNSVAAVGDFYSLGGANIPIDNVSGVPIGWTLHTSYDYFTLGNRDSQLDYGFDLYSTGNDRTYIELEYSYDNGSTWTAWNSNMSSSLYLRLTHGQSVKLRGNNPNGFSTEDGLSWWRFETGGPVEESDPDRYYSVSGDINTLINGVGGDIPLPDYCFRGLFNIAEGVHVDGDGLVLPSTTLGAHCYHLLCRKFEFTTLPTLPATTMAEGCYYYMFLRSHIASIPSNYLPATTLAANCYEGMFAQSDITSIPSGILRATTLADYCYKHMFFDCTSLTSVPSNLLPATTLAQSCYESMLEMCTSLTTVPSSLMSASTLAEYCCKRMFASCTSLTGAPNLPATTIAENCYYQMFAACTSMTTAPATLPATTLAEGCYNQMFAQCSVLTSTPTLPATTLVKDCYRSMFTWCTSVDRIVTYASDISATDCITNWLYGNSNQGDFYNLGGATYPSGYSGIPTSWTVHTSL